MSLFRIETHIPPVFGDYIFEKDVRAVQYNLAQCIFLHNQSYEFLRLYSEVHDPHKQCGPDKSKCFFSAIVFTYGFKTSIP